MFANVPDDWQAVRENVFSTLTPLSTLMGRAVSRPEQAPPIWRPFSEFVAIKLVVDTPRFRVQVMQEHLDKWGTSADEVFRQSWENLPSGVGLGIQEDGLWSLTTEDGYENARLALPGWLSSFNDRMEGDPIAVVPHARAVLVGDSANAEQVRRLCEIASKGWRTECEPISPALYCERSPGRTGRWQLPKDTTEGVRRMADAAMVAVAQASYNDLIRALNTDDRALSRYEAGIRSADSTLYSFSRANTGERAHLPRVEFAAVCDGLGHALFTIPMASFVSEAKGHWEPICGHTFYVLDSLLGVDLVEKLREHAVNVEAPAKERGLC